MTDLPLVCVASTNRRPVVTEVMRREAAVEVAKCLLAQGLVEQQDFDDSVEDIVKATSYERHDGYKIARELESRHHWDCDMQIAEILEGFDGLLRDIFNREERKWAAENPREPMFKAGDDVLWRGKRSTVHGIYAYGPQYYEVREGDMKPGSYYVVPFEEVTTYPLPAVPEPPAPPPLPSQQ